jgi:hypothetical protein
MCEKCELNDFQKQNNQTCTCECKRVSVGYFVVICEDCYHAVERTKNGLGIQYVNTK